MLLVEDEEPLRRVLRDLLEREGFTVVEAADGVQALDEVDRSAPDVLVLDLNLPRLDGYGVLSHLRARPSTARGCRRRAFRSGRGSTPAKPSSVSSAATRSWISRHSADRE